jgi:hypothetical protein
MIAATVRALKVLLDTHIVLDVLLKRAPGSPRLRRSGGPAIHATSWAIS